MWRGISEAIQVIFEERRGEFQLTECGLDEVEAGVGGRLSPLLARGRCHPVGIIRPEPLDC